MLLIVQNFTLKLVIHANPASHLAIHVSTKITPARVAMDVMDSHFFMDLNASQNARLVPMLTENSKFVKVVSWYDNEWGYSNRLVELAHYMGHQDGTLA